MSLRASYSTLNEKLTQRLEGQEGDILISDMVGLKLTSWRLMLLTHEFNHIVVATILQM